VTNNGKDEAQKDQSSSGSTWEVRNMTYIW